MTKEKELNELENIFLILSTNIEQFKDEIDKLDFESVEAENLKKDMYIRAQSFLSNTEQLINIRRNEI